MRDDFLRRNGIIGGPWSEGRGKSAPEQPDVAVESFGTGCEVACGAPSWRSWSFVEAPCCLDEEVGVLTPAWGGLSDLLLGGLEEALG